MLDVASIGRQHGLDGSSEQDKDLPLPVLNFYEGENWRGNVRKVPSIFLNGMRAC
jgi:hypothetical protein